MKFTCPVCKTAGDIPDRENSAGQAETQTTCLRCGTKLSVEHSTGRVKPRPAGQDPQEGRKASRVQPKYAESSVLSMKPQPEGKKDYLATGVFVVVLCALIATGVYFSLNIKTDAWNRPLQTVTRLVDEVVEYGKTLLGEFQEERRPASRQARQAQRLVRKGYEHYKDNRLKKALQELSQAIETHPENPDAYFWRARTYIRLEQYDNAIVDLKTVVYLKPRYSPAYDNLGWLFMRRDDFDESLSNLNKSIELKPDNGWAHYMRGRVFFKKGDFKKAVENAEAACKLGYKDGCRDAKRYAAKLNEND
jgi:tetratricopeptide (TPR) repeat protein